MGLKSVLRLCGLFIVFTPVSVLAGETNSPSNCKTKLAAEVLVYQGGCVEGFVQGPAEVKFQGKRSDGSFFIVKQYGWFEHGQPSGIHVMVNLKGVAVNFYNKEYLNRWSFTRTWQRMFDDASWVGLKTNLDGPFIFAVTEEEGGEYFPAIKQTDQLLKMAVSHLNGQKSVAPEALQEYLDSLPVENPAKAVEQLVTNKKLFPENILPMTTDQGSPLRENEILVHTREGCGLIIPYQVSSHVKQLSLEAHTKQLLINSYSLRYSWEGKCFKGLAIGAGRLAYYDQYNALNSVTESWYWHGRKIGHSLTLKLPTTDSTIDNQPSVISRGFFWNGVSYVLSADQHSLWVNDSVNSITYSLLRGELKAGGCGSRAGDCITVVNNKNPTEPEIYRCTDAKCDAVWNERVGPILQQMNSFITQNSPAVETAKQSMQTALQALNVVQAQEENQKEQKKQLMDERRHQAEQRKEQERLQALRKAGTDRKTNFTKKSSYQLVASPSLDKLIQQILKVEK